MKLEIEKIDKKHLNRNVPLEDALNFTGFGKFTVILFIIGSFAHFSADIGCQVMSFLLPVASCDLQLTSSEKGLLASMAHTGMLASSHLCGVLSDVYGRRKVVLVSLSLQAALSVISSFAPNATVLMICWFFYGNLAAGVFTPVLVYIAEFCPKDVRTKAMIIVIGVGALAEVYLAGVGWLIIPIDLSYELFGGLVFRSWRLYLALLAVPSISSIFFLLKLPESPKFLLNQGKKEETLEILKTIYAVNNNDKKENFPVSGIELDLEDKLVMGDTESGQSLMKFMKNMLSQTAALFNRTFIFYTLLSCVVLLGIGASYMALIFWIPDQISNILEYSDTHNSTNFGVCETVPSIIKTEGQVLVKPCEIDNNMFILAMILGFAQLISAVLTSLVEDRMNKKILLGIILIIPGLLCILTVYLEHSYMIIGSLITASALTAGAYAVALSFVMKYFPTSIRSNATAVTMAFGRIGISGFSLLFGILLDSQCQWAYWSLGAVFIGSAVFCAMLPSRRKIES